MNKMKVSCSGMLTDAKSLREAISDLENNSKSLEESMLSLSGCWEGPTWDAFRQAVGNDTVFMNQLISYLKNYADRLESASGLYHDAEQDAAMKARSIIVL